MIFCPTCDNILDITKNPPKTKNLNYLDVSENELSNDESSSNEEENDIITQFIKDVLEDRNIEHNITVELKNIKTHKEFMKLDKSQKTKVSEKVSELTIINDGSTSAYFLCGNCSYFRPIESETLLVSRVGSGKTADYVNFDKFQNKVYDKMLPITRDYICVNKNCATNKTGKDKKSKEAVMFRVGNNTRTWYTCKVCLSYWKGS